MKYIKNKELTFADLNSIIIEMNDSEDHVLCLDTCKLIPTKENNTILDITDINIIGEKCRIDLTQHDSFNLETAVFIDSHILHRGIVKIYGGIFHDLEFTSTLGDRMKELHTFNTSIKLYDTSDQRLYVDYYYGECEDIIDAIDSTVEKENFPYTYHVSMSSPEAYLISVYKIEKDTVLADTSYTNLKLVLKLQREKEGTVHIIIKGGDSKSIESLLPVLNILKDYDKVYLPEEIEIDIENFKNLYPNVVILNDTILDFKKERIKNTINSWLKESPKAFKIALRECDIDESAKD